ncbi:ATP-dependent helicase [Candidatus Nomurabacteria bacterium]|nr:ATP-dependent helicase [Candidatus Nomurabacteria bacterium]
MTGGAPLEFTDAQRALIETSESTYVEACPGAGKTHAIVERFVARQAMSDRRRGVALLSFTNAAVDEARRRCSGAPDLMRVPNFVGTIDAFINRFIVSPVYIARTGGVPTFRDTWASVPGTRITVKGVPGTFGLQWFDVALDGSATLVLQRVPPDRRAGIGKLPDDQLERVLAAASAKWKLMISRGVIDSATSRLLMVRYLGDEGISHRIRELVGARFAEVIVDEVQDCTAADVLLLNTLKGAGLRMICVGDPDQAIYGFRGSGSSSLQEFLSGLALGQRLNGNFRSSPAISAIVGSMRYGAESDAAIGVAASITEPVLVTVFRKPGQVRSAVASILQDRGIPESDAIVLAHALATSRGCAGAGGATRSTDSRLVSLALAVHRFHAASSPPASRRDAARQFEKLIYELGAGEQSISDYLADRGITERSFQYRCLRILTGLNAPFDQAPSLFRAALIGLLGSHQVLGVKVSMLRTPNGDKWPQRPSQDATALAHATIHGFKGLQHRAVVLILPQTQGESSADDGVEQWLSGRMGESRRVLYVGASRAEELLILATHESSKDRVLERLAKDGVEYVVHD